eukprot:scaffold389995_cov33-Prasinocladus_malaysianus.AAC.1
METDTITHTTDTTKFNYCDIILDVYGQANGSSAVIVNLTFSNMMLRLLHLTDTRPYVAKLRLLSTLLPPLVYPDGESYYMQVGLLTEPTSGLSDTHACSALKYSCKKDTLPAH